MTGAPEAVRATVERRLDLLVRDPRIIRSTPLGGGCINPALEIEVGSGEVFFLKWHDSAPPGVFVAEADGLTALAAGVPAGVRVPEVVVVSGGAPEPAFLLLEFIPRGTAGPDFSSTLGQALAELHEPSELSRFGWPKDNYIGTLAQTNVETDTWSSFWCTQRLETQASRAASADLLNHSSRRLVGAATERAAELLEGRQGASLLHGDLWSGNVYADPDGQPVLIDPSVYRGSGLVDLAMTELFGGFEPGFYRAYAEARGIPASYQSWGRDLYQLYPLLVHLNLFGSAYLSPVLRAARAVLDFE